MPSSRSALQTWLQLFRAPNLFTVPGDPLAGFLLASPAIVSVQPLLLFPIGASLCFYAGGLLLNDLMDLEEDRAERPNRPLPSGGARALHVWFATGGLALLGLALCLPGGGAALLAGISIVLAIVAYDCGLKKIPVVGAINMGLCRGLSVLLGAAFSGGFTEPALAAGLAITCYIAAVTHLARYETTSGAPIYAIFLPIIGPVAMMSLQKQRDFPSSAAAAVAAGMITFVAVHVWKKKWPLPPSIGSLIRVLLIIQAFYCLSSPASTEARVLACLLVLLWPVSRAVSKRFYAS